MRWCSLHFNLSCNIGTTKHETTTHTTLIACSLSVKAKKEFKQLYLPEHTIPPLGKRVGKPHFDLIYLEDWTDHRPGLFWSRSVATRSQPLLRIYESSVYEILSATTTTDGSVEQILDKLEKIKILTYIFAMTKYIVPWCSQNSRFYQMHRVVEVWFVPSTVSLIAIRHNTAKRKCQVVSVWKVFRLHVYGGTTWVPVGFSPIKSMQVVKSWLFMGRCGFGPRLCLHSSGSP